MNNSKVVTHQKKALRFSSKALPRIVDPPRILANSNTCFCFPSFSASCKHELATVAVIIMNYTVGSCPNHLGNNFIWALWAEGVRYKVYSDKFLPHLTITFVLSPDRTGVEIAISPRPHQISPANVHTILVD